MVNVHPKIYTVSAICLIIIFTDMSAAYGQATLFRGNDLDVNKRIMRSFDANFFPGEGPGFVCIKWRTDAGGRIRQVKVDVSSTDLTTDLACIEAVCSHSPEPIEQANRNSRYCIFDSNLLRDTKSVKTIILDKNPKLLDQMRIPVKVAPISGQNGPARSEHFMGESERSDAGIFSSYPF